MKRLKDSLLRGSLVLCLGLMMLLDPVTVFADANTVQVQNLVPGMTVTRFGGADQYETAAKIAEGGWSATSEAIVLCSGMQPNLIDAIAAGPLAALLGAPIILTDGGTQLNKFALKEIIRLQPKKAYITSGQAVIKQQVLDELQSLGITPVELGGFDQFDTSVNIAREMQTLGANTTKIAVVAGWLSPADALSIGTIAASQKIPILATAKNELPPKVRDYMKSVQDVVTDSYVIGGSAVVSDIVMDSLPGTQQRYFGNSKYDTNLDVLEKFANIIQSDKVFIANGETLVDALAGVPLAAKDSAPILLMDKTLASSIVAYAKSTLPTQVIALGGEAVVSKAALDRLSAYHMENVVGNVPGNINNQGYVSMQGDYVYYFQTTGTTLKTGAIYKMNKDGTGKIKLCETGVGNTLAPYINVVGDWVYYRYSTPVKFTYSASWDDSIIYEETAYAGSIYKIRTDGTGITKLSEDNAQNITVFDDWIYYDSSELSTHDNFTEPGIYKIKTDGTGKVKLADFEDMGYIVNIADGFIYYYSNYDGTYRIELDGSGKTPILDGFLLAFASNDWLYYIGGDFRTDAQIYKTKFDGSQYTLLYSGPALGNRLNVSGDDIYFATLPNKGTYKVKTDGTGLTKISDDSARSLCIAGDYLYYNFYGDSDYPGPTYRIKIDGTDRANLSQ